MAIKLSEKQIKDGWQIVKFGEIAEHISVRVNPTPKDSLKYIGLEHLDSGSIVVNRWGSDVVLKGQKLKMKKGEILFAKRNAYLKRVAVAPFDGIFSAHGMVIRPKGNLILHDLLPFFMQSDVFMDAAIRISEGSLSPTIKWKTLAIQEFPLPPIERQKEILEVLEKLEEGVITINETLEVGNTLKRVLQYRLTNYGLKDNGTEPNHWKKSSFIDLATLQRGFDLPEQNRIEGEFPIFASTNIVGYHKDYMVEAPGVVTGRSGTIGQVAYTDEKFWPLNTALYVKDFHGNNAKYVKYFIESFHVERFATGTGVPTLNRNIVHKEKVNIPPVNEQEQIVEILSSTDDAISSIAQRKNNYLKLRSNVFSHLFGGVQ